MEAKDFVVILGTAHGINVPGKRSPNGVFREYRYSREIVAALKAELEASGLHVEVDYAEDTVPAKQSEELKLRCKNVNAICLKYGTKNCIYVSIHVNAAGADGKWHSARGWSVYTSPGVTKADTLATCIWNAAVDILPEAADTGTTAPKMRSDMSDGDPDYEASLYVLKFSMCPAVLTENLFQDNVQDVAYLTSKTGRKAIVELHKQGIMEYLRQQTKYN